MDQFSERMQDHARDPRNNGCVENPDGFSHTESACGDWVQMSLRLNAGQQIAECRFTSFGCGSAVASASVLTELARGKTLAEAARITADDVVAYLGGLPEHKLHCSKLSHDAFQAAVASVHIPLPV